MFNLLAEDIDDVVQGHRRVAIDLGGDEGKLAKGRPRRAEMLHFLVIWIISSEGEGRTVVNSQRRRIMTVLCAVFVDDRLSVETKNKFSTVNNNFELYLLQPRLFS